MTAKNTCPFVIVAGDPDLQDAYVAKVYVPGVRFTMLIPVVPDILFPAGAQKSAVTAAVMKFPFLYTLVPKFTHDPVQQLGEIRTSVIINNFALVFTGILKVVTSIPDK